jgi:tetratricopeptide (TPR) repeat protein
MTILVGLKLFDEAEAAMREGQKRAPHDPHNADGLPQVAERRGDTENAKKFPTYWKGYAQGAICLVKMGQSDAAEALIETAVERSPDVVWAWIQRAHTANCAAGRRSAALPAARAGNREDIRLLLEMDRLADAEAILPTAIERSPAGRGRELNMLHSRTHTRTDRRRRRIGQRSAQRSRIGVTDIPTEARHWRCSDGRTKRRNSGPNISTGSRVSPSSQIRRPKALFLGTGARYQFDIRRR